MTRYGGELGSSTACSGCEGKPCKVGWVITAGSGYANDPIGARAALVRAHRPVVTHKERAAALAFYNGQSPEMRRLCEKIRADAGTPAH